MTHSQERMAEQGTERRNRLQHYVSMNSVAERRGEYGLAQTQPSGAKFALDLQAVQLQRNFEIGEKIRTVKNAVAQLHVKKLDCKDISRVAQFIHCENKGSQIALLHPPSSNAVQTFNSRRIRTPDHAQDVQIRMSRAEFASDRRAIEHDGL